MYILCIFKRFSIHSCSVYVWILRLDSTQECLAVVVVRNKSECVVCGRQTIKSNRSACLHSDAQAIHLRWGHRAPIYYCLLALSFMVQMKATLSCFIFAHWSTEFIVFFLSYDYIATEDFKHWVRFVLPFQRMLTDQWNNVSMKEKLRCLLI